MSESSRHKRAKSKAAGRQGITEKPLPGGRRLDAASKKRATEVERSGKKENQEYRILTNSKGPKGQRKEFEKTWIKAQIEKNRYEMIGKPILELQKKYQDLENRQGTVDKFF